MITTVLDGVMVIDGKPVVDPHMVAEARDSVAGLRSNARDAEKQAAYCGHKRRRTLERLARDARTLADRIEIQCERIERGET